MKIVILAAGYATRLYPLTEHFPKPLLDVGGRTILDRLLDRIRADLPNEACWLVSNRRFAAPFEQWAAQRGDPCLRVLDDGSTAPENRLGAIGDLAFALERMGGPDDLFVVAADNIFEFPIGDLIAAFRRSPGVWVCVHQVTDPARQRRTGIAELAPDGRVMGFEEKPAAPRSCWAVPPLYCFDRVSAARVREYLAEGRSPDSPGRFIEWLVPRVEVRAVRVRGTIHDIGTIESLEACRRHYAGAAYG